MQTDKSSSTNRSTDPRAASPVMPVALSDESLARRRLLMKSLGKGAAVVAASVPLQSLAAGNLGASRLPGTTKKCIVSGNLSTVGSVSPLVDNECSGYSPTYYSNLSNWPALPAGKSPASPFSDFFPGSNVSTPMSTVVQGGGSDAVWAVAYLNSLGPAILNFPYTDVEVVNFYTASNSAALNFFQQFMQNRNL